MVSKEQKATLIKKYGLDPKNTGSVKAQIAILTSDILNLTNHLKLHKKDIPTRRSLLKKVAKRKKLLSYLMNNDFQSYKKLINELGLRK